MFSVNDVLWREVIHLRQEHIKQKKIVEQVSLNYFMEVLIQVILGLPIGLLSSTSYTSQNQPTVSSHHFMITI